MPRAGFASLVLEPDQVDPAHLDAHPAAERVTTEEIAQHGYVLTPERYVEAEEIEEDDELFEDKMRRLMAKLEPEFAEGQELMAQITSNLRRIGYGR
jgi:type I restriction-modification system DNA methylase subunit